MNNKNKILDAWLVLEYQGGNQKAMATLVKRWHPKLCRLALWYTQDLEEAKDIVQDSWGQIIRRMYHIKDPNCFGSWALTIVRRNAIDWTRQKKKERITLADHYDITKQHRSDEPPKDASNTILMLRHAIRKLPIKQQQVLTLFYLEDLTISEIGTVLEIPMGTVKSRLFKAREQLKIILKQSNYEK